MIANVRFPEFGSSEEKRLRWERKIKEIDSTPDVEDHVLFILSGLDQQLGKFPVINFKSIEPLLYGVKHHTPKKFHPTLAQLIIDTIDTYHYGAKAKAEKVDLNIRTYFGGQEVVPDITKRMEALAEMYRVEAGVAILRTVKEMRNGPGGQGYYEAWLSLKPQKKRPMTEKELQGAIYLLSERKEDLPAKAKAENDLKQLK